MKKVLISYCTEYEAGWGQRPDGFMITTHKHRDKMMARIEKTFKDGSYECYCRYDEPTEIFCSDKTFKIIKGKMKAASLEKIAFFGNLEKNKLELFKEV